MRSAFDLHPMRKEKGEPITNY